VNIHLVTVAGGYVGTLPRMLEHYRTLGVESFFVNVHLAREGDPVREEIEAVTRRFGCGVASVSIGDWQQLQRSLYARQREQYPGDWFVLADVDEFQKYPRALRALIEECDRKGYEYIRGCIVDRIARDGRFPPLAADLPIADQFPLGASVTNPILGADPRKVVAVKGALPLVKGQHHAIAGVACPARECYAQVHHFKWVEGVGERLAERAEMLQRQGAPHWVESARFAEYYRMSGGALNLDDPHLHVAEAEPEYAPWEVVKKIVLGFPRVISPRVISPPAT
jgi:hypothetical protein